jgi:hypothetical protein
VARTTIANTVERIRRQLASSLRYEVNVLGANINTTETVITLDYDLPPSLRAGAVISIGAEDMRVVAINAGAREVTVLRGWQDSDGTAAVAGAEVWINPRFTGNDIYDAMFDEVSSWPANLYRVVGQTFDVASGADVIELPVAWYDSYGVIDVRRTWTDDDMGSWPRIDFRLQRGPSWTGVSSGLLLRLIPGQLSSVFAGQVYVSVALPFDLASFNLADDLVTDLGLQPSMLDVVSMGVKLRLMGDTENGRSQRRGQDESRRAEEVPPGSSLQTVQAGFPLYLRRRQEEVSKLQARFPIRGA